MGNATIDGDNGADWHLKYTGQLPDYYITKAEAKQLGWISSKGNLSNVLPNKMIFGGKYFNDDGKLPSANGRI